MDKKTIYDYLPVFLQNILVNIYSLYLRITRYSKGFKVSLDTYERNLDIWDTKEFHKEVRKEFLRYLELAERTKFWRKRFEKYGVEINRQCDFKSELSKLPTLTKEEVKENIDDINNRDAISKKVIESKTGGTTGRALHFPQTLESIHKKWAIWWRYREMHGLDFNTWCGWFGGKAIVPSRQVNPPYWRKDYIGKQVMFSPLHLNASTYSLYYDKIKKEKLSWLHGYSSQLSLLASYINEGSLPPIPSLKIITIGAENLSDRQRSEIKKAFQVPIRQHYGLAEGVANISEWADGKLRVDKDFCYVEFEKIKGNEEIFRIIGTNYTNPAFPLIRYYTGDLAKISRENNEIIVKKILGRDEDFVTLPNGNRFGPVNLIFKKLNNIREAQLYQPEEDLLIFRIVVYSDYNPSIEEKKLEKEIENRLTDNKVVVKFEYLDKLPRTESGKLKTVISEV